MANQTIRDGMASTPFAPDEWVRVGETLRTFRELRGLSPLQLADRMQISRVYLHNIEAGRKKLTNVLLARAATTLRIKQLAIMCPEAAAISDADSEEGAA